MRQSLITISLLLFTSCGSPTPQTTTASSDAVRAFYVGLAALQVGDDPRAKDELTKATQLASNEPAAWTNLGILQLRQKDFDASGQSLEKARALAEKNSKIYETIALLEKQRGNFDASQANLQKAIDLDDKNAKAIYALAAEKERATDDTAARKLYDTLVLVKPNNLEARLSAIRLAAKQGAIDDVRQFLAPLKQRPDITDGAVKMQFFALSSAVDRGTDMREISTAASYLRNALLADPKFRADVAEVRYSDTSLGEPFTKPLVLQVPSSSPAPADKDLKFEAQRNDDKASWRKFFYMNGDGTPVVASGLETTTKVGTMTVPFAVESESEFAAIDYDYDFKNDVALAGPKGFRLFKQEAEFLDKTEQTKLPPEITSASYAGVWVLDIESDGDLDLLLARTSGVPVVLQNNADDSFTPLNTFTSVNNLRQFAAGDVDEDGDADALLLDDSGKLRYFSNERGGTYSELAFPTTMRKVSGFAIGDIGGGGQLNVVVLNDDGSLDKITRAQNGGQWTVDPLIPSRPDGVVPTTIMLQDLDNNGLLDVLVSGGHLTKIWLATTNNQFVDGPTFDGEPVVSPAADLDGDGRLDLIAAYGVLLNRGTKNYKWQTVRPRASKTSGDQRVNSFGIGGELELRSGLLVQKQLITEPVVHFGLGEQPAADVLRVVWQNGFVQAEFDLKPNQSIEAVQRLKGSCPHLITFNGEKFAMVKDAPPWSPALGLKINAQDTFGIIETEEWFKVPGVAMKPTNENVYELRITSEYWETYYIDRYSLLVVDHPENTEVFTDERFSVPPPPFEVYTTGPTREFASARGTNGEDVSAIVRSIDEKYLDDFQRGTFQGVARDHFVEVELPSDAAADKRLAIIADGWVHPTDASINVQLGQSSREKPRSLSLEIRDADGSWKVAKENLGFPAGKMKTMVIELPAGARAARLRTNMEVFWDRLAWAVYEESASTKTTRIEPAASDLRYRGFSVIEKADDSSPEKPDYGRLLTTAQRWRSMEGYYTRFGDVLELLSATDDRYVLMNAGDELVVKFAALPPPAPGIKRDFVLIGNGWIKDGDLNSVFSKTLLPLPTHGTNDYSKPPTTLENDPVYQKHKSDWLRYHTRYIAPDEFRNALR